MNQQRGEIMAVLAMAAFFLACIAYLLWAMFRAPEVRDVPATATPTVRVVVLPTATSEPLRTPTVTVTPIPAVIDLLPRETGTRVPASTLTLTPTATPIPPTPSQRPVQRG